MNAPNSFGPSLVVPVLKLDGDLVGATVHEGNGHLVLADADDEDAAAESGGVDGGVDGGFDAGALDGEGAPEVGTAHGVLDAAGDGFRVLAAFDEDGVHRGHEVLGKGESTRGDVGNHEGTRPGRLRAEEGDETDGAGTADEEFVPESKARAFDAGEGDGEGFEHGTFLEGHAVRQAMEPFLWVEVVAREQAVVGRGGEEDDVGTGIVPARPTKVAARLALLQSVIVVSEGEAWDGKRRTQGMPGSMATRSPTFHSVTSGPMASTTPEDSCPSPLSALTCIGPIPPCFQKWTSLPQTPVALTWTRT